MQKKISCFLFLMISYLSFSQNIFFSDNVKISVLTCGPGEELYSKFGHSAFRVQDFNNRIDIIYNYGLFDFSAPNFNTNFAKGKLNYKLGWNSYENFYAQYKWENRDVKQQVLNLSVFQKKQLIAFLKNNAKPKNATYQYDFFYNNCATKIRSVLEEVFPNQIEFRNNHITSAFTLRELINNNVSHNTWTNVGINIALGSVVDVKASAEEYQFLPKYIFEAFNNASINSTSLVNESSVLLTKDDTRFEKKSFIVTSPLVVITFFSMLIIVITYSDYKKRKRNKTLDFVLLFTTGSIGVIVLLLWFATDHTATANNFNILWAFAPNLIVAFLLFFGNLNCYAKYFSFLLLLLIIQGLLWILRIEEFGYVLTPLFISLSIRYAYLIKFYKGIRVI